MKEAEQALLGNIQNRFTRFDWMRNAFPRCFQYRLKHYQEEMKSKTTTETQTAFILSLPAYYQYHVLLSMFETHHDSTTSIQRPFSTTSQGICHFMSTIYEEEEEPGELESEEAMG